MEAEPVNETADMLLNVVSQSLQGLDLLEEIHGKFELDPTFQPIIAKPKEFRNFEVDGQLVYLKKQRKRVLCIPKISIQGRSAHEIVISEAHSLLAHLGASKTLDYLKDHCWWKNMVSDVQAFCETCHTCKTSKLSNQKPYGLLNPLSVPSYPWESIGMDFVGPLPGSGNRDGMFDSITVIRWQSPNQCSAQQQNPKTEGSAMSVTVTWPKRLQCDSPRGSAILCTETSKTNKGVVIVNTSWVSVTSVRVMMWCDWWVWEVYRVAAMLAATW